MTTTSARRTTALRIVRWGLLATAAGVAASLLGLTPGGAIAVAVLVVAAGIAWSGLSDRHPDRAPGDRPDARPGTRSDAAWLAWGLSTRGPGVGDPGLVRVRAFTRERLRRHGLRVDDPVDRPELERMLGPAGMRIVIGGGAVTLAAVEHCLDVLDTLDDERGTGP